MSTPTKEDFLNCHENVAEPFTIVDHAARDALGPLVESWAQALANGEDLRKLLPDISGLEKLLAEFRMAVIDKHL